MEGMWIDGMWVENPEHFAFKYFDLIERLGVAKIVINPMHPMFADRTKPAGFQHETTGMDRILQIKREERKREERAKAKAQQKKKKRRARAKAGKQRQDGCKDAV